MTKLCQMGDCGEPAVWHVKARQPTLSPAGSWCRFNYCAGHRAQLVRDLAVAGFAVMSPTHEPQL